MTDTDHYVIPRCDWAPLRDLLAEIPAVLEDLAITITRQDRITAGALGSSGDPTQPLPINLAASAAADDLRGELLIWVKHTAKHRGLVLPDSATLELARWLNRHLIDLAQTPEADTAHDRIEKAIRNCKRTYDRPAEKLPWTDPANVEMARDSWLNQGRIIAAARDLDEKYHSLTENRMRTLIKAGAITPIASRITGRLDLYLLGEVLDAHLSHPSRRKAVA